MMPVAMEGVVVMKSDGFGEFYFGFKMHARSAAPGTGAKIPLLISYFNTCSRYDYMFQCPNACLHTSEQQIHFYDANSDQKCSTNLDTRNPSPSTGPPLAPPFLPSKVVLSRPLLQIP